MSAIDGKMKGGAGAGEGRPGTRPLHEMLERQVVSLTTRLPRLSESVSPDWLKPRPKNAPRPLFTPEPPSDAAALSQAQIDEARLSAELEGLKAAQEKVEAIVERYLDGIERIQAATEQAARPHSAEVVALALVVAREVIGHELTIDREALNGVLDRALAAVGDRAGALVRLGAADLEYVRQRRPDLLETGIQLVEDPSLAIGGCIVETRERVIDASVEARLEAVRDMLSSLLDQQPANDVEPEPEVTYVE